MGGWLLGWVMSVSVRGGDWSVGLNVISGWGGGCVVVEGVREYVVWVRRRAQEYRYIVVGRDTGIG
jgi:hypothetical protein